MPEAIELAWEHAYPGREAAELLLGRPFRGALSTVAAPLHGLYCEYDTGSCKPDQRWIAALCRAG